MPLYNVLCVWAMLWWPCPVFHLLWISGVSDVLHITALSRLDRPTQRRHSLLTRVDKVQGPPRSKGPPSATCKNLCHEIVTDTLLTSDTLTVSASCCWSGPVFCYPSAVHGTWRTEIHSCLVGKHHHHGVSYSNSLEDPITIYCCQKEAHREIVWWTE